jgi:hypothetical protein
VERLPSQALVQKLARLITGLKTFDLLLGAGHLQELGSMMRSIDEINQDILFISFGIIKNNWTSNHTSYLNYFWSENKGGGECPVRRKTIRAFVHRAGGLVDTSTADRVVREIYQTYSDYLHARSAPIMAMVVGPPARFDLDGIADSEARKPYIEQAPSYFYRSIASTAIMARTILPDALVTDIYTDVKNFETDNAEVLFA